MNLIELTLCGRTAMEIEDTLKNRGVLILKIKEYADENGVRKIRFRSVLTLPEINGMLEEKIEGKEPTKEVVFMHPNEEKTMTIAPVEGIARIGEGLNTMMSAFLAPALQALEAQQLQTRTLVKAAQDDLSATQAKIQREISEALEEPKTLFQECLLALDRQEKKLTEIETRAQATKDELVRDIGKLRVSFDRVVKALQGIVP